MRTNIEIDDKLMSDTLKATGLKTKREAVEQGGDGVFGIVHSSTGVRDLRSWASAVR